MGQLEDITYAALRKYDVIGEIKTAQTTPSVDNTFAITTVLPELPCLAFSC